jgi:hypothetical protein
MMQAATIAAPAHAAIDPAAGEGNQGEAPIHVITQLSPSKRASAKRRKTEDDTERVQVEHSPEQGY